MLGLSISRWDEANGTPPTTPRPDELTAAAQLAAQLVPPAVGQLVAASLQYAG